MKRIKIAGLCLVAVFAFSAVAAASAVAQPTFKACVKASPAGTGKYNDKACASENAESKGKYELAEVAVGTKYLAKSKTTTIAAKSKSGATENIVCGKDAATLEVTGPSSFAETVTLSKCVANGNKKTEACANVEGTIRTEATGELYFINAAETQLGVFGTPPINVFTCGSQSVEVENFLIGSVENGPKGFGFHYTVSEGKQANTAFFVGGEEIGGLMLVTEIEGEPGVQHEATLAGSEEFKAKGVSVR